SDTPVRTYTAPSSLHAALPISSSTSVINQSVSFTVLVTANAPGSGTPTGTVQFQIDGQNFGAPVSLVNGQAASPAISTLTITTRSEGHTSELQSPDHRVCRISI